VTVVLTIRQLHSTFALIVIFANAFAGLFAFAAHKSKSLAVRPIWWLVATAQTLVFVQAILGVALQSEENLEPRDFHYLYGFSMIVFIALLYGYRTQVGEKRYLLYGFGSLFIMGLGIRAFYIGT
jgi:hypothetical protein